MPPSAAGFACVLIALGALPLLPMEAQFPTALVLLALSGVLGGIFMIPCGAFIQVRAPIEKRGTIIASVSSVTFAAILLASAMEVALVAVLKFATSAMLVTGILAMAMAIWLRWVLNEETAA